MLFNFLEQMTRNGDTSLTESIMDGYMAIFEATLAPVEYEGSNHHAKFTTSKGNVVEVSLDGGYGDRDISFKTNGKYTGEGHEDPEILRGVFYVVNDILKEQVANGKVTTLSFMGMSEECKPQITQELHELVGSVKNLLIHANVLFVRDGKDYENLEHVANHYSDFVNIFSEIIDNEVSIGKSGKFRANNLFNLFGKVDDKMNYMRQMLDNHKTDENANLISSINFYLDKIQQAATEVIAKVGRELYECQSKIREDKTKRTQAYRTLTRRYYPDVRVEEDGNNTILHMPEINGMNT